MLFFPSVLNIVVEPWTTALNLIKHFGPEFYFQALKLSYKAGNENVLIKNLLRFHQDSILDHFL